MPAYVSREDTGLVLKAVARARIGTADKERMLARLATVEDFELLLEIAVRLKSGALLRHMHKEVSAAL